MAAISMVDYVYELKHAGFSDKQSEVQARRLEQVINEVKHDFKQEIKEELQANELVTKKDLQLVKSGLELAIEKMRHETLRFVIWTGVGVVLTIGGMIATLAGMIAKGLHWF